MPYSLLSPPSLPPGALGSLTHKCSTKHRTSISPQSGVSAFESRPLSPHPIPLSHLH